MHDFRILSAPDFVNLIFDLVIPPELDDAKGQEEIASFLRQRVQGDGKKKVYLVINFDDSLSDFLVDSDEEKAER